MTQVKLACFGAATVFSADSEVCRQCQDYSACSEQSIETLREIRQIINVEDILARHMLARKKSQDAIKKRDNETASKAPPGNSMTQPLPAEPVERHTEMVRVKFEQSEADKAFIAKLAVKARPYAVKIIEEGAAEQCIEAVKTRNPDALPVKPEWFVIAVQRLLQGGFTRAQLRLAYIETFGWKEETAAPYVSLTIALLPLVAAVQDQAGRIVLAPATAS